MILKINKNTLREKTIRIKIMKNKTMKIHMFIILINIFLCQNLCAHHRIKLALLTVRDQNDAFFSMVVDFMRASCDSLDMDLNAIYANNDLQFLNDEIKEITTQKKYDAVVLLNFKNQLLKISQTFEDTKTPFFIYNSGFDYINDNVKQETKFKYLLGEMLPDDELAGYELAKTISQATGANADGKIHLLGIAGTIADQASVERIKGLNKFINESKGKIIVDEVIYANWKRHEAAEKIEAFHNKYPMTRGIWAANDEMALGVIQKLNLLKFKANVVGIDWTMDGINAVKNKKLLTTIGGHFMCSRWYII